MTDDVFDLNVVHPVVDVLQLAAEDGQHDDLGERGPEGIAGLLGTVEIEDFPLHAFQLIEERLFDVIPLVELDLFGGLGGGVHGLVRGWTPEGE